MVKLVFVHGIGGPRDVSAELAVWTEALAVGVRRAGHGRFADEVLPGIDRRFADYSDLFHRHGGQGDDDGEPLSADELGQILDDIAGNLLENDQDPETSAMLGRVVRRLHADGQSQGAGDLLGRVINAATTLLSVPGVRRGAQWASERELLGSLGQVGRYLSPNSAAYDGRNLKITVRNRVRVALDGAGPAVVVAHSLGSVVAYETLHEVTAPVPLFVTIGSPLVLRGLVRPRIQPRPPSTPECVGRWLNFWDKDDIVAARPIRDGLVHASPAGIAVVSEPIRSNGIWTHTATKYLKDAGVAGRIAEELQRHLEPPRQ